MSRFDASEVAWAVVGWVFAAAVILSDVFVFHGGILHMLSER